MIKEFTTKYVAKNEKENTYAFECENAEIFLQYDGDLDLEIGDEVHFQMERNEHEPVE